MTDHQQTTVSYNRDAFLAFIEKNVWSSVENNLIRDILIEWSEFYKCLHIAYKEVDIDSNKAYRRYHMLSPYNDNNKIWILKTDFGTHDEDDEVLSLEEATAFWSHIED